MGNLQICCCHSTQHSYYVIAWQLLAERYDNKRRIIRTYVKALLEILHITRKLSEYLSNLINKVEKNIRCLENLEQPIKQ